MFMETENKEILLTIIRERDYENVDAEALRNLLDYVIMSPKKLSRLIRKTIILSQLMKHDDVVDNRSVADIGAMCYLCDSLDQLK
jgi:hypothetical protein